MEKRSCLNVNHADEKTSLTIHWFSVDHVNRIFQQNSRKMQPIATLNHTIGTIQQETRKNQGPKKLVAFKVD